MQGRDFRGWGYILPAAAWTVAFFVLPFLLMACYSLWRFDGGKVQHVWTYENYAAFLARPHFHQALVNSLEVTAITVVLSVILAYPLAWILAFRVPPRWQTIALVLAVLPFWTSYLVRSYSWLLVLSDKGVINSALLAAGIIEVPPGTLAQQGSNRTGVHALFHHAADPDHLRQPGTDQPPLPRSRGGTSAHRASGSSSGSLFR